MSKFWSTGSTSSSSSSLSSASSDCSSDDDEDDVNSTSIEIEEEDPDLAWEYLKPYQQFLKPKSKTVTTHIEDGEDSERCIRIACISDTHGAHRSFFIPKCDILIHAGDFTNSGEPCVVEELSNYFGELIDDSENGAGSRQEQQQCSQNGIGSSEAPSQPEQRRVKHDILCIAGNHELSFQPDHYEKVHHKFHPPKRGGKLDHEKARNSLTNCTYLQDKAHTLQNINFYGSPWTPEYHAWAFNLPRTKLYTVWDAIPDDTDVLITHGPPLGRGDHYSRGMKFSTRLGCVNLLQQVQNRIKPRLHVFGHVHSGYGASYDGQTMYVNAAAVCNDFAPRNPCIVVDLPKDGISPPVVVYPKCGFTEGGVLDWFQQHKEYWDILPYLEKASPMLEGDDVVKDMVVPFMDLIDRLGMHRCDRDIRETFYRSLMHVRADSYG